MVHFSRFRCTSGLEPFANVFRITFEFSLRVANQEPSPNFVVTMGATLRIGSHRYLFHSPAESAEGFEDSCDTYGFSAFQGVTMTNLEARVREARERV